MNVNAQLNLLSKVVYQEKTQLMYDELLNANELMKQYEMMSFAEELANDDAQYYGA